MDPVLRVERPVHRHREDLVIQLGRLLEVRFHRLDRKRDFMVAFVPAEHLLVRVELAIEPLVLLLEELLAIGLDGNPAPLRVPSRGAVYHRIEDEPIVTGGPRVETTAHLPLLVERHRIAVLGAVGGEEFLAGGELQRQARGLVGTALFTMNCAASRNFSMRIGESDCTSPIVSKP